MTSFQKDYHFPEYSNLMKKYFFGHILDFSKGAGINDEGFKWRVSQIQPCGAHFIRFFSQKILMVYSPEMVKFFTQLDEELLIKSKKFKKIFPKIMHDAILFKEGKKWKNHRKIFDPFFHAQKLKSSVKTSVKCTEELIARWSTRAESGESIRIDTDLQALTLKTIMTFLLGIDLDIYNNDPNGLAASFIQVSDSVQMPKNVSAFLSRLPIIKNFCESGIRLKKANQTVHKLVADILATSNERKSANDLAYYLSTMSNLSPQEITGDIFSMIFAGHETNKSTITWCLYELSKRPKFQEELFQWAMSHQNIPIEDLVNQDSLLTSFISEVQRCYSVAPEVVPRILKKSVTLPNGTVAPAGTQFMVGIWESHMNPYVWHEPEIFKPKRFLEEEVTSGAFIPYSTGPRKCIGNRFAARQIRVILLLLVKAFKISHDKNHQTNMTRIMTMNASNGVKVFLQSR